MDLSWSNEDAYIAGLYRLDTSPAPTCLYGVDPACASTIPAPVAGISNAPASLSLNLGFEGLTDSGASCLTELCVIPLAAVFTDSVGNFTNLQDMRDDTLDITNLTYTKTYLGWTFLWKTIS
jgi:hypothetical protein